jgi:hypothetical protein
VSAVGKKSAAGNERTLPRLLKMPAVDKYILLLFFFEAAFCNGNSKSQSISGRIEIRFLAKGHDRECCIYQNSGFGGVCRKMI